MTGVRITTFEADEYSLSVTDIREMSLPDDPAKARRKVMRELGVLVDQMLLRTYGIDQLTLERIKS